MNCRRVSRCGYTGASRLPQARGSAGRPAGPGTDDRGRDASRRRGRSRRGGTGMRTQRTIGIILVACLLAGLTSVVALIAWLGVGPALGLVAVAIAGTCSRSVPGSAAGVRPTTRCTGCFRRRPAARRRAVDDESDHDRRPTRARLPLVAADRIRPRRVVQLRLDRQRRPSERGAHRARDAVRGRRPRRDDAGVRPRRASDRTGSAHRERRGLRLVVPVGRARRRGDAPA